MHSRSQDKLDKDDPDKEKKDKKKEKRNSKHQEIFDKEFKPTDIPLQQAEAVILSETVTYLGSFLVLPGHPGPASAPQGAEGTPVGFYGHFVKPEDLGSPEPWP